MAEREASSELSSRGTRYASVVGANEVWEIIRNLWDPETNPDGYVSLGVAENDMMHSKTLAYIQNSFDMSEKLLTYYDGASGSRRLQTAIAKFLTRRWKPVKPFEQSQIIITNGCSSLIEIFAFSVADPGDGFLLGQPLYRAFMPDLQLRSGAKVVKVAFGDADPMGIDCVPCYEKAIQEAEKNGQKIKGLILCHPHNPLGRCYSKEVLIALMKLCQKYRVHLISDEIYGMSVWENKEDTHPPPVPFSSASTIDTNGVIDPHLVHIIWGMSKDFGCNGLRIGCVISQANKDLIKAVATLALYTFPSTTADTMSANILEDDEFTDEFFRENSEKLSRRYSVAIQYLKKHNIPYLPGVNAAFFIVADLGTAYRAKHPDLAETADISAVVMEKLLEKRVYLVNSAEIASEKSGWFRIVFSQDEDYLKEGLKRIVAAVEDGISDNSEVQIEKELQAEEYVVVERTRSCT